MIDWVDDDLGWGISFICFSFLSSFFVTVLACDTYLTTWLETNVVGLSLVLLISYNSLFECVESINQSINPGWVYI